MYTNNEFDDASLEFGEKLIKRYFQFLVDEYGFKYDKSSFNSNKMLIKFELGHKTPSIFINQIGEPDFARLYLEWILKFFHGTSPSDIRDYTAHSLAENMAFISDIFRNNSRKLVDEFDDWWIPAHVFVYRSLEKEYEKDGQTESFLRSYKHYYDYLKNKDAI